MSTRIPYNKTFTSDPSVIDPNTDGYLTAEELVQTMNDLTMRGVQLAIDHTPTNDTLLFPKGTKKNDTYFQEKQSLFKEITAINPVKGLSLQSYYLQHGSSEKLKRAIQRQYNQVPAFKGQIWEKAPNNGGQSKQIDWEFDVMTHGLSLKRVPVSQRDGLIQKYRTQIADSEKLVNALQSVSEDESTYKLLEHYLQNGGRFEILEGNDARYEKEPLKISIGTTNPEGDIFHELLHYLFDVNDVRLFEAPSLMGLDHYLIAVVEFRYRLLTAIDGSSKRDIAKEISKDIFDWNDPQLKEKLDRHDIYNSELVRTRMDIKRHNEFYRMFREIKIELDGTRIFIRDVPATNVPLPKFETLPDGTILVAHTNITRLTQNDLKSSNLSFEVQEQINKTIQQVKRNSAMGKLASLTTQQIEDIVYLEASLIAFRIELARLAIHIQKDKKLHSSQEAYQTDNFKMIARQFAEKYFSTLSQNPNLALHLLARSIMTQILDVKK